MITFNLRFYSIVFCIFFIFNFTAAAQIFDKENIGQTAYAEDHTTDLQNENAPKLKTEPKHQNIDLKSGKSSQTVGDEHIAEDEPTDWKLKRGEKQWNIEPGFSPVQPTFFAEKEYDADGRKFGILSVRWGRVIGTVKNVTYEYQIEAVPVFLAFNNEVTNPAFRDISTTPNETPTIREDTYGFGFSPLGFRFLFRSEKRLKPFIALHTGFALFNKPLPTPDSMRFNFTGDFGGGLQYQIKRDRAISFGYRYYHISNINLGETNPGYNANIFYVGYSFFYK